MEAPSRSWTLTDEFPSGTPAQAPLPFTATTGMGISGIDFTLSSNLALEAPCTGCAAPSVQAVVTLNLTSNSDLNDLLAGLLDNNTVGASGELGVNGSFEDVTYQLPSLGFNPVVMSALANAVAESDGLNGTPVSEAAPPPPPPPPCSGLICLWNTVSGIVVGIAGAIYGAVWTAVEAATQFLKQLGAGLSHLAEVAESAAVGVLAAVGAALEAALQALLAFVEAEIIKLLTPIITPIVNAAKTFDITLGAASNTTVADIQASGSVSTTDALTWAHTFDGIAELGAAVGIAITIVLVVTTSVGLGASLVVGLLLSLIPTFLQSLIPGLASISSLTSSSILNLEASFSNPFPKTEWEAIAGAVAVAASSSDFFFALITAAQKGLTESIAATLAVSIIVDLIVLPISIITWASHNGVIAIIALVLALVATFIAFQALKSATQSLKTYATVSFILAGVGAAAAGGDVYLAST